MKFSFPCALLSLALASTVMAAPLPAGSAADVLFERGTLVKGPVIDADGTAHPGSVSQVDGPDRVEAPEDHQTPPSAPSMSILPVAAATPSPPPKPEEPAPKPAPAHKDAEQKDAKHKNKQADKHKTHDAAADDGTKQGKEVKQNSPPEPQPDAAHVQGGNRGPVGDTPTIFAPDA